MSIKPEEIVEWANENTPETRQGGSNKLEPTEELKRNGSLDGNFSLNHLNFMFNLLGLWSKFTDEMVSVSNGTGKKLTIDGHFSFIVAFDKTNLDNFVQGIAFKNGENAASLKILNNNSISFGSSSANGDVPINGASSNNIVSLSLNFKTS
jgi:hypothetical protein